MLNALPGLVSWDWVGNHDAALIASSSHNQGNLVSIVCLVFQGEVGLAQPEAREDFGSVTYHWNTQGL